MATFIAIKIHYDHRPVPVLDKYQEIPTSNEYQKYKKQYYEKNIGGDGFHECMNFFTKKNKVRIYLPPGYFPAHNSKDELIIFSFTYKSDKILPSRIVGVHAGAKLVSDKYGIDSKIRIPGVGENLLYHAEAPSELVTLFSTPIKYNVHDGHYTPPYEKWGSKLRKIDQTFAANILSEALSNAWDVSNNDESVDHIKLKRELRVIENIIDRYALKIGRSTSFRKEKGPLIESANNKKIFRDVGLQPEEESNAHLQEKTITIRKRHNKLMNSFKYWIDTRRPKFHFGPIKENRFDAVIENWHDSDSESYLLIEAKTEFQGTSGRNQIRQAIGQLFDYRLTHFPGKKVDLAILVPSEPPSDIKNLLKSLKIEVLWFEKDDLKGTIKKLNGFV